MNKESGEKAQKTQKTGYRRERQDRRDKDKKELNHRLRRLTLHFDLPRRHKDAKRNQPQRLQRTPRRRSSKYEARSARTTADKNPKSTGWPAPQIQNSNVQWPKRKAIADYAGYR